MANDLYSVLGVGKSADTEEIKKSYRKLASKLHPDKNPGNTAFETQFKEVNHAYQVLSDPTKRALYDEFGEDGLREGFDAEQARNFKKMRDQFGGRPRGGSPADFFGGGDSPFGGDLNEVLFGRQRRARRGSDMESSVTIDFASAVRGTMLELRPRGSDSEPVKVRVPPGAEEGSRVRIAEQGAPGSGGGPAGDLILQIHVTPHPHFWREGDDLHLNLPVTPLEAYSGAKVKVPTIDGTVNAKLPARAQSGMKVRLKGKGVNRKGREPGDLYIHLLVQLPTSDEAEELIQRLDTFVTGDVREGIAL
jgi:curved DNA-binding protein